MMILATVRSARVKLSVVGLFIWLSKACRRTTRLMSCVRPGRSKNEGLRFCCYTSSRQVCAFRHHVSARAPTACSSSRWFFYRGSCHSVDKAPVGYICTLHFGTSSTRCWTVLCSSSSCVRLSNSGWTTCKSEARRRRGWAPYRQNVRIHGKKNHLELDHAGTDEVGGWVFLAPWGGC